MPNNCRQYVGESMFVWTGQTSTNDPSIRLSAVFGNLVSLFIYQHTSGDWICRVSYNETVERAGRTWQKYFYDVNLGSSTGSEPPALEDIVALTNPNSLYYNEILFIDGFNVQLLTPAERTATAIPACTFYDGPMKGWCSNMIIGQFAMSTYANAYDYDPLTLEEPPFSCCVQVTAHYGNTIYGTPDTVQDITAYFIASIPGLKEFGTWGVGSYFASFTPYRDGRNNKLRVSVTAVGSGSPQPEPNTVIHDLGTGWLTDESWQPITQAWTQYTAYAYSFCEITLTHLDCGDQPIELEPTPCGGLISSNCLYLRFEKLCSTIEGFPKILALQIDRDTCIYSGTFSLPDTSTVEATAAIVDGSIEVTIEADGITVNFTLDLDAESIYWWQGATAYWENPGIRDDETWWVDGVILVFDGGQAETTCKADQPETTGCSPCQGGRAVKYLYYDFGNTIPTDPALTQFCVDEISWERNPLEQDENNPCRWTATVPAVCNCLKNLAGLVTDATGTTFTFAIAEEFGMAVGDTLTYYNSNRSNNGMGTITGIAEGEITVGNITLGDIPEVDEIILLEVLTHTSGYEIELVASQDECGATMTATITETETSHWIKFSHNVTTGGVFCDGSKYALDYDSRSGEGDLASIPNTAVFTITGGADERPTTSLFDYWVTPMTLTCFIKGHPLWLNYTGPGDPPLGEPDASFNYQGSWGGEEDGNWTTYVVVVDIYVTENCTYAHAAVLRQGWDDAHQDYTYACYGARIDWEAHPTGIIYPNPVLYPTMTLGWVDWDNIVVRGNESLRSYLCDANYNEEWSPVTLSITFYTLNPYV